MAKTFEQFEEEIEALIKWYNENKFQATNGLYYKEILAKFHEGEFGYSAVLYYRWIRVKNGEPIEKFHRYPNDWRIIFDKTYNMWTATKDRDRYTAKNLSTIKKYMR